MLPMIETTPLPSADEQVKIKTVAKVALQKFEPYLAQFASTTNLEIVEGLDCYTDGETVSIGYDFVKNYPRGQVFAFYHEILHTALNHTFRFRALARNKEEHFLYNVLADAQINSIVLDGMAASGTERTKYEHDLISKRNVTNFLPMFLKDGWEEAYNDVKDKNDIDDVFRKISPFLRKGKNGKGGESGSGEGHGKNGGNILEKPGEMGKDKNEHQKEDQETRERKIKERLQKSIQNGKLAGNRGGQLNEKLQELWTKEKVPWSKILADAIQVRMRSQRTWSRFNKKSL